MGLLDMSSLKINVPTILAILVSLFWIGERKSKKSKRDEEEDFIAEDDEDSVDVPSGGNTD